MPFWHRLVIAAVVFATVSLLARIVDWRMGRKELAATTKIPEQQWLDWANNADCMRIKGMGSEKAKLLRRAGVTTVGELSHRNPKNLAEAMAEANDKHKLMRVRPTEKSVRVLVERAKKLPRKITY